MDILLEIDATGLAAAKALDLAHAYSQRNRATFRKYADILYAHILDTIHPRKKQILDELETEVGTAGAVMRARLWDYSVTYPTDGNPLSALDAVECSNRGNHTVVFDDGKPMSVDAIFRNTDLAWRLAFTFGSKFRVSFVREDTKLVSGTYSSYRIAVYLHYEPHGIGEYGEQKMIEAYKAVCDRQLHVGTNVYMTARF